MAPGKVFLELFAGAAGLTRAVRRQGLEAMDAQDLTDSATKSLRVEFGLRSGAHFKKLKTLLREGRVHWLHGAPPCKTFSRARRTDQYGSARVHRSEAEPDGIKPRPSIVA